MCVVMDGTTMMPMWFAGNWDTYLDIQVRPVLDFKIMNGDVCIRGGGGGWSV